MRNAAKNNNIPEINKGLKVKFVDVIFEVAASSENTFHSWGGKIKRRECKNKKKRNKSRMKKKRRRRRRYRHEAKVQEVEKKKKKKKWWREMLARIAEDG